MGRQRTSLIGREAELAQLEHFLRGPSTASCLVFSGDAGIGKTALWQVGLDDAAEAGFCVLSTRANQGEAGLLFAALADLAGDITSAAFDRVPAPQRHALEVALRREGPDPSPPDPLAIFSGFASVVRSLAEEMCPLIAVDDVQWLDPSSQECLLFLARRLHRQQVRFLLSRRGEEPSSLERELQTVGVEEVSMHGLSLGAIARLLLDRFDLVVPRRVLRQLYETSHGNPLFAMELARTLRDSGCPEAGSDLPAPKVIDEALEARVRALPRAEARILLAVALSSGLSRRELASLADPLAVEDVIDAGLLVADRARVRPSHPMIAAAARTESSAAERRDLHLDLARTISDPILSARHLALATLRPDDQVAQRVESASRLALDRGALPEAEELCAHAWRLTPAGAPAAADRLLSLARSHLLMGDSAGAAALLRGRVAELPPGRPRALGHLILARSLEDASVGSELERALAAAGAEDGLRALALSEKATLMVIGQVRSMDQAEEIARQASAVADGTGEERRAAVALAWARVMRGRAPEHLHHPAPARPDVILMDIEIERPLAIRLAFRGQLDQARRMIRELSSAAAARGEPRTQAAADLNLGEFHLRSGDLPGARAALDDVKEFAALAEARVILLRLQATIAVMSGDSAGARRLVSAMVDLAVTPGIHEWHLLEAHRVLGLAAVMDADPAAAAEEFDAVWQHCGREGVDDPGAFPVAGDLVEALVESGNLDRARAAADRLNTLSIEQQHPWGLACYRRVESTISGAEGDIDGAADGLLSAAATFEALTAHFDQARCLLHSGHIQLRARRRAGARDSLQAAARVFDRLGCSGWADRARDELAQVSGRKAVDEGELTPSERRVAELAAAGRSNKEIGQILYVSVATVEAHLTRVYSKLGLRSRSQLATRLGGG